MPCYECARAKMRLTSVGKIICLPYDELRNHKLCKNRSEIENLALNTVCYRKCCFVLTLGRKKIYIIKLRKQQHH